MSNLFSIFDPLGQFNIRWNWLSLMIPLVSIPPIFWTCNNQFKQTLISSILSVHQEIKSVFSPNLRPGTTQLIISLFSFIATLNIISIFPFIFTPSGHISISLSLALPLWVGYITTRTIKAPQRFLAHLVPLGTPPFLMPFMVIIETISNVIRPITLSVRLAANLVAGHLLLSLLGNMGASLWRVNPTILFLLSGISLLLTLEIGVAVIQAYVFRLLRRLYVNESSPNDHF